jgi:GNAT superfamily N-acetyltransferase
MKAGPRDAGVSFRQVRAMEIDGAYSAYLGVFEWLNARGVRQWLRALPSEAFVQRQRQGQLFGLYLDDRLAAVVTLAFECSPYWQERLGDENRWWIKTLAVVRDYRGRGLGAHVVHECELLIQASGATEAFLDCVDVGFLPGYYARLGYEALGQKEITYPSGNTFLVTLMKKNLPAREPPNASSMLDQFRQQALAQPGAGEASHMGHADFRVNGKIFATLGYPDDAHGMVKLTPEQQRALIEEAPAAFFPCAGAWGQKGATAVRLSVVKLAILRAALDTAARNLAAPKKRS